MVHPSLLSRTRACFMVMLAGLVVLATSAGHGQAASSSVVVTMDVLSTTTLDTSGCANGQAERTAFGTVLPGTGAVTSLDCSILFGSTNDTSTLRAFQPDGRGTAMAMPPTSATGIGTNYRLLDLEMIDANNGWAVGDGTSANNRVYSTTDGGVTWTGSLNTGLTTSSEGVAAVSASVVWAVGNNTNQVIRTINGGTSWTTVSAPAGAQLNDITAIDDQNAWALGFETVSGTSQPRVWRTTNGGGAWTVVFNPATASTELVDGRAFAGNLVYIALSNGTIFKATDGATFNAMAHPSMGGTLTAFATRDSNRIAAVTGTGQMILTTDAAAGVPTWSAVRTLGERTSGPGLAWAPNNDLWASGANGSLQRSVDEGVTWTTVAQPHESGMLRGVEAPSATRVVVFASSLTTLTSNDTGATWTRWKSGTGVNWRSIDGVDSRRLWRVGSSGAIATSTDGGVTWADQTSPTTNGLYAVTAVTPSIAVAVGAGGTIVRTTDGGTTWAPVASGTTTRLRDVTLALDEYTMFAAGDAGTLLRSTDRGATWSALTSGVTDSIWSVAAWSTSTLLVGTATPVVRTSTDGGATWTARATGASEAVTDAIVVPGTTKAYLVSSDTVAHSTDSGATWPSTVNMPGSGDILDLDWAGSDTLWATGAVGRVHRGTGSPAAWASQLAATTTNIAYQGVAALGPDAAAVVSENNQRIYTNQPTTVPDYTGTEWGTANGMFAMCLRAAPGASNTWPTTGSCPQANGTNWRAVPLDGSLAASKVGDLAGIGTATASFRFGVTVPPGQTPGSYSAPVVFELVAPSA